MFSHICNRLFIQRKLFVNNVKGNLIKCLQSNKFQTSTLLYDDSDSKKSLGRVENKISKSIEHDKTAEEAFWKEYQKHLQNHQEQYKPYLDRIRYRKHYDNPVERTIKILRDDILEYFGRLKYNAVIAIKKDGLGRNFEPLKPEENIFPEFCDVVIIGGGIIGTSIAYHLQEKAGDGLRIVVVEKDHSYSKASTVLSCGGIRQQFSSPENIVLSKYGMDFFQNIEKTLATPGYDTPNIGINYHGYLILASEAGMPQLLENHQIQKLHNVQTAIYTKEKLKKNFPWINTDGIEGGSFGLQNEGWFDPWSLLVALTRKTKSLGSIFVNGEVVDASFGDLGDIIRDPQFDRPTMMRQLQKLEIKLQDGEVRSINCAACVIASGAWSKDVGKLCGIGNASAGISSVEIPVEPRKRYVYCVKSPDGPGLNCPIVIDSDGTYFRREGLGDLYLCGRSPAPDEEPSIDDLNVDEEYFREKVWPSLSKRCPSFENLKMHSSWAGYYDYNTFDQNAIIDRHPLYSNLFMATGFSGHGLQHGIGVGKAMTEIILEGSSQTINLERFSFERLIVEHPVYEKCIY